MCASQRFLFSFSAMRTFTNFFMRTADGGLSTGKWMVPLESVEILEFVLERFHHGQAHREQTAVVRKSGNPSSAPLYLKVGMR
jgi:hypothetical protein